MIGLSVLELVLEYIFAIPTYCLVGVSKLGEYSWRLANFMMLLKGLKVGKRR